ncbi:DUF333 domain-containing protein [Candidatus Dojkabacteria bacterium]|nr:DUF333 domain-containing protein [Candidatus Dojkabacteria bacterium]
MRKRITFILFLLSIISVGFYTIKVYAISNPASEYCEDMGYTSEIRTKADGSQYGVCIFSDGSMCEEWAFYTHECGTTWIKYSFPDIANNSFAKYIENLYADNIVSGFSDGTYGPKDPVSRAQMAKFIVRAFDFDLDTSGDSFPDADDMTVDLNEYIQTIRNLEIVSGYSDGMYHPERNVTRGQVTKYIVKALEVEGMTVNMDKPHTFPDIYGNDFEGYIAILTNIVVNGEQIISGYSDGYYRPSRVLTRGQMAKIVDLSRKVEIGSSSGESICITAGGTWIERSMQCNDLSRSVCEANGGEYDSCAPTCGRYYIGQCTEACTEACYMDEGMSQSEVCIATGGRWVQAGLLGTWMCEYLAADAGAPCTDSTQCENLCVVDITKNELAGICRGTNLPFGCYSEMIDGESQPMICVD